MNTKRIFGWAAAVCLLFSSVAHSALVTSLKFKDPSAIISPTDAIDIWVTLSVAAESDPLSINFGAGYPFGLQPSSIPTYGQNSEIGTAPFASYTSVSKAMWHSSYIYDANGRGDYYDLRMNWGADSFLTINGFSIAPGESRDFLLGSYIPRGVVTPGDYIFYNVAFTLVFLGLDAAGNGLGAQVILGETCPYASPSCALTRTVVSDVPIPAAGILFLSGLGVVGAVRRIYRR